MSTLFCICYCGCRNRVPQPVFCDLCSRGSHKGSADIVSVDAAADGAWQTPLAIEMHRKLWGCNGAS